MSIGSESSVLARVLDLLDNDPAFRDQLIHGPGEALDGYDLSAEDLETLSNRLGMDDLDPVKQRTVRAAWFGLLAQAVARGR